MSLAGSMKWAGSLAAFGLLAGLTTGIIQKSRSLARAAPPATVATRTVAPPVPAPTQLTSAEWTTTPERVDDPDALPRLPSAAPRSPVTGPQRETIIGPAATTGSAMLDEPPLPRAIYPRVEVVDSHTLRASGKTIRLADIDGLGLDQTCKDAKGQSWPCGRRAHAALVTLLRGKPVICYELSSDATDSVARCRMGRTDLAAWLVEQGWARPHGPNDRLAKLFQGARTAHSGQFLADATPLLTPPK